MNIFLTSAAGYIGAAVADQLLAAGHRLTGLARSTTRADELRARGITPLEGTLDDATLLAQAASAADAVIHTAAADHRASTEALLAALSGTTKTYLHLSGAGVVADMAGGELREPVYDESTPVHPLPARVPRVALNNDILAAARDGLRTVVIAPPMVYGHGGSLQIPKMIAVASESGSVKYVGAGTNTWSCVHVDDLARLFVLALEKAPAGGTLYYADNGTENQFKDIAEAIGRLMTLPAQSLTVPEAYAVYGQGMVDLSFGANCRVRGVHARRDLGWEPTGPLLLDDIQQGSYAQAA